MNPVILFGGFILSYSIDLVVSVGCQSCPRGTNPIECLDTYQPPFALDKYVCANIRDNGEVPRLCKKYGGSYLVKCELEDYSEFACVSTCIKSTPSKSVSDLGNNSGSYVTSSVLSIFLVLVSAFLIVNRS